MISVLCSGRQATAVNTALPHFAYQRAWHLPQTSAFFSGHSQNLPKLSGIAPVTTLARGNIKQGGKSHFLTSWQSLRNTLKRVHFMSEGCAGLLCFHYMQTQVPLLPINQHNCNSLKRPKRRPEAFRVQLN